MRNKQLPCFWQPKTAGGESGQDAHKKRKEITTELGSQVIYLPRFLRHEESWKLFDYLDSSCIPWTRPTIRVFGRSSVQPRDLCYVADEGLPAISYSGYQPHAHSWSEFPPLRRLLRMVHEGLAGRIERRFNSLVMNRYRGGNDYVSWHSDDNQLYGPTPEIASLTFGCEREFLLKKKHASSSGEMGNEGEAPKRKRFKGSNANHQSSVLRHGSLLLMRGYTQRDWLHSIPKRPKLEATRINLTFRTII